MMSWGNLFNLLKLPFLHNLANRLVNRYTAHGIIIIILQLESMGILPEGIANKVDGLASNVLLTWLGLALGIYFIFHIPKPKNKLQKLEYQIAITEAELKLAMVRNNLIKFKDNNIKK